MISELLLDAIYATSTGDGALMALLTQLADAFDCVSAAMVYVDPTRPAGDVALGYGVFSGAAQARYIERFAAIDPAPAVFAALPIGTATATHRMFTPQERADSRFLNEFYHPLGLYEALGAPIVRAEGRFGILGVHRTNSRPAFSDDEIGRFGEIASHVARAFALRARFFVTAKSAKVRGDMLDSVATGIMTVDSSARLIEANAAARAVLDRGDGLFMSRSGRIRLADRSMDAAFNAALLKPDVAVPSVVTAPRASYAIPYALRISRADGAPGDLDHWVVQIAEDRKPSADVESALVHAFHLTPASARLTAALLDGEDLQSYAVRTGITRNTAKFHLKAAFKATGTNRQVDLVRLAAAFLRDLSVS